MKKYSSHIFVFKNRALGDSIISLGAIQYLKRNFPDTKVTFGVPKWVFPLFTNLETEADEILPVDLANFQQWLTFYSKLKGSKPDVIIELFQSGRGKKFGHVYQMLSSATRYFGNNHHKDDGTFKKSNIQRDIDGIRSHMKDLPKGNFLDFCPKVKTKNPIHKKNKIIFGIVATRETKLWPIENYHELAKLILNKFPNTQIQIPISPNKLDQRLKQDFLALGNLVNVSFLEASLSELPLHIAAGKLYIGNDTGIKHLSIALGLKSFSFFGPEPPIEWHPYNKDIHPYYYVEQLDCRTKTAHFCGLNKCDSMICLNQISADQVFSDIEKSLKDILC